LNNKETKEQSFFNHEIHEPHERELRNQNPLDQNRFFVSFRVFRGSTKQKNPPAEASGF
jgi:hypothetical protein